MTHSDGRFRTETGAIRPQTNIHVKVTGITIFKQVIALVDYENGTVLTRRSTEAGS